MTSARGVKAREGVKMGIDAAKEAKRAEGKGESTQGLNGLQKVVGREIKGREMTLTHTLEIRSVSLCAGSRPLLLWKTASPGNGEGLKHPGNNPAATAFVFREQKAEAMPAFTHFMQCCTTCKVCGIIYHKGLPCATRAPGPTRESRSRRLWSTSPCPAPQLPQRGRSPAPRPSPLSAAMAPGSQLHCRHPGAGRDIPGQGVRPWVGTDTGM